MEPSADHTHHYDLQLGADGRGQIFGDFEGYVRRCRCGEYDPAYTDWLAARRTRLANELYVRVVQPDTIWWDDLTSEMQESWLRAADYVLSGRWRTTPTRTEKPHD